MSIPAVAYEESELSNLAFNRWIGDIYGALTDLEPELGFAVSGAIGFEINGENSDTAYWSGNAFHADLAISEFLTKDFSVGVLAVGVTAAYSLTVAGTPVSTPRKVLHEVDVENRPKGTISLFTVAFSLSGRARSRTRPARGVEVLSLLFSEVSIRPVPTRNQTYRVH